MAARHQLGCELLVDAVVNDDEHNLLSAGTRCATRRKVDQQPFRAADGQGRNQLKYGCHDELIPGPNPGVFTIARATQHPEPLASAAQATNTGRERFWRKLFRKNLGQRPRRLWGKPSHSYAPNLPPGGWAQVPVRPAQILDESRRPYRLCTGMR